MKKLSGYWIAVGLVAFQLATAQPVLAPDVGHCAHCGEIGQYQADLRAEVQRTPNGGTCPHCIRKMRNITELLSRDVSNLEAHHRSNPEMKESLEVSREMGAGVKRLKQAIKVLEGATDQRSRQSALDSISTILDALERNKKQAEKLDPVTK